MGVVLDFAGGFRGVKLTQHLYSVFSFCRRVFGSLLPAVCSYAEGNDAGGWLDGGGNFVSPD